MLSANRTLQQMEDDAKQHLANVSTEWDAFCGVVETIKVSGLWRDTCSTWKAYCKDTFGVTDSRIRQHLSAHDLSGVMEGLTGIPLTSERQARYLREFADTPDKQAQVHVLANHAATELDEPIARRHYQSVDTVLNELTVTSGNVSIHGTQIPANISHDAIALAIVEDARESGKRLKEYRTQGLQDVPVVIKRFGDEAYAVLQLPADYPVFLLENYIAKVPKAIVRKPQAERMEAVS